MCFFTSDSQAENDFGDLLNLIQTVGCGPCVAFSNR